MYTKNSQHVAINNGQVRVRIKRDDEERLLVQVWLDRFTPRQVDPRILRICEHVLQFGER
jgi:hypothetical protein